MQNRLLIVFAYRFIICVKLGNERAELSIATMKTRNTPLSASYTHATISFGHHESSLTRLVHNAKIQKHYLKYSKSRSLQIPMLTAIDSRVVESVGCLSIQGYLVPVIRITGNTCLYKTTQTIIQLFRRRALGPFVRLPRRMRGQDLVPAFTGSSSHLSSQPSLGTKVRGT